MNIGLLGASAFAKKTMLGAFERGGLKVVALASRDPARAKEHFGSPSFAIYGDYNDILNDPAISSVYISLPNSLHAEWTKRALEAGKHVFCEKPFCLNMTEAHALVELASQKRLVVFENFAFPFHKQFQYIHKFIQDPTFGPHRLIRATFCFPDLGADDIRYKKELGGGALRDAGCYVVKLIQLLAGQDDLRIESVRLSRESLSEVDTFGSIDGFIGKDPCPVHFQLHFGFGHFYQCSLEVVGEFKKVFANRIFTAPPNLNPLIVEEGPEGRFEANVGPDDQYAKCAEYFKLLASQAEHRPVHQVQKELLSQVQWLEHCIRISQWTK